MQAIVSSDEVSFRREVRDWLAANCPDPSAIDTPAGRREYALAWQRRQHDGGWAGISWPRAYGGRGLSEWQQIIWYEEYARAGAPSTLDVNFVGLHHAGPTLIALGSEKQRAFHLPKILRGESLWCQGFSEPGAGSDLAAVQMRARVDGDHLVVSGQKIWSSYADIADYQELLVRTDSSGGRHKGLTWVICDMKSPGITVRPIRNIAGSANFAEIFYDDVRIPLDQVVGSIDDGWRVAMATLGFERGTASIALQIELQTTVEGLIQRFSRAPRRPMPGERITHIESRLASLWARVASLRSLSYATLSGEANDSSAPFNSSVMRLQYAELVQEVHRFGYELSGAGGLERGQEGWTHSYLYSLHDTIAGGTSEIQRNVIAERLLGMPRGA